VGTSRAFKEVGTKGVQSPASGFEFDEIPDAHEAMKSSLVNPQWSFAFGNQIP
jgi:hypothetical protein